MAFCPRSPSRLCLHAGAQRGKEGGGGVPPSSTFLGVHDIDEGKRKGKEVVRKAEHVSGAPCRSRRGRGKRETGPLPRQRGP